MTQPSIPARPSYVQSWREAGGKVCAAFPAQYPKELLWAYGVLPVEVWDPPLAATRAPGHLQPYICSVVRQGLELLLLAGAGDSVDAILFPHTCDSLQNLGSLVGDYLQPGAPCLFFYNPKAPFGEPAREFYLDQLFALDRRLAELFGPRPQGALEEALAWSRRLAGLYARAYAQRAANDLTGGAAEFYAYLRAGEYMHPRDLIPLLKAWLAQGEQPPAGNDPRVVLSGVLPGPPDLLATLDQVGLAVGHDDLLSMSRRLLYPPPGPGEPLAALSQVYVAMPPCSTRGTSLAQRLAWLKDLAGQSQAAGVVFAVVKFCEPELFDLPELRRGLKQADLPSLVLEVDVSQAVGGQETTRLEAFREMLA